MIGFGVALIGIAMAMQMAKFGVTSAQMQTVKPSLFNRSYTANMLTAGQLGGTAEIIAAVFPCS